MRFGNALPLLLGLVAFSSCGVADPGRAARGRFEKTVALEPGGSFHLENVNGQVTVQPWDQNSVRIEADKTAPTERLLDDIRIEIRGEGARVDVKTSLPARSLFSGTRGNVDYVVRLPAKARVDVRTVNGTVRVEGMAGTVHASTVNGGVNVTDSAGLVDASTMNGSIRAGYRALAEKGHHSYSTTNGSVTVYLPADAAGEFEARTINGEISTDFGLEVSGKIGKRLRGRLGKGGATFEIRTVNGSVRLLKNEEKVV